MDFSLDFPVQCDYNNIITIENYSYRGRQMTGYAIFIFILILLYTFYMGVNDGSNAIATTVATRAVQPRTAIVIAALINFAIPVIIFVLDIVSVADNISAKLVYNQFFDGISDEKAFSFVVSGILGAIVWGGTTFALKIPNSTSHTVLGGIIGAGIAAFGFGAIQWKEFVLVKVVLMIVLAPVIGLLLGFFLMKLVRRIARRASRSISAVLTGLQRLNLMILAGAFSSNNAQKSIGMFFLVSAVGLTVYNEAHIPIWIVLSFAGALTLGLLLGGYRVINTVGRKIFKLQPVHSVIAQFTTSLVMITATSLGISLSTGQIMSSSIMGVGAAERANGVHWNMAIRIVVSWLLTLPCSAGMGALFYLLIGKAIFGV